MHSNLGHPALEPILLVHHCPRDFTLFSLGESGQGGVPIHRWENKEAEGKGTQGHMAYKGQSWATKLLLSSSNQVPMTRTSK